MCRLLLTVAQTGIQKLAPKRAKERKSFSLTGKVKIQALLKSLWAPQSGKLYLILAAAFLKRKNLRQYKLGGPSGGCLPESLLDSPVDFESLLSLGATMGSGSFVVADETTRMVEWPDSL